MSWLNRTIFLAPLALSASCTERTDYDARPRPASVASASAAVETVAPAAKAIARKPASYGAAAMAKVACLKVEGNSFLGTDCPSGFAVFGPYASLAAGSEVEVNFSFKPAEDVAISIELVSDTGKIIHAALGNQPVKKNDTARFSLRTQPQADTKTLEARVVVYSDKPVSYTIGDFVLNVK